MRGAERTLADFCEAARGRAPFWPRIGTLVPAGGRGGGWPPDPRARRRDGRLPQGCALVPLPMGAGSCSSASHGNQGGRRRFEFSLSRRELVVVLDQVVCPTGASRPMPV
jgi:hypothetical protein